MDPKVALTTLQKNFPNTDIKGLTTDSAILMIDRILKESVELEKMR